MALADEIQALRDGTLADLTAAHDYFVDTKIAWRIVQRVIADGNRFRVQNTVTGTVTTHVELAGKAPEYISRQLAEATFQQFISIFEAFFFDFLRLWLLAYPQSLFNKMVDFKTVWNAQDKDAITQHVVSKEVNEVLYDRPTGWFEYLTEKVNLGCPTPGEIDRLAEAKASRDTLVHGRGIVGKVYLSKAGRLARFRVGERVLVHEQYHRETWELLRKVVTDISTAAIAKAT